MAVSYTHLDVYKRQHKHNAKTTGALAYSMQHIKYVPKIINNKLRPIIDTILLKDQSGFRKGRSYSDNSITLKLLREKRRECNLETHIVLVDYIKAFDNVIM